MQLGVAKKIKNGARKIVLDQAEEARIAAFAAFKSLGVHVPQFSRPILPTVAEDSCTRVNTVSYNEEETSNSPQPINSFKEKDTNSKCDYTSEEPCEKRLTREGNLTLETSREVISSGALQCNNDTEGKIEGENLCTFHDQNTTEKGPINACNFPGGFDSFLDQWYGVSEFSFDVHFLKHSDTRSLVQFEVIGLAICWKNSPVFYCSLPKDLLSTNKLSMCDIWEVAKSRWNMIGKIMQQNGVKKTTWNLKTQIQALKAPCISIQRFGRLGLDHKNLDDIKVIDSSYIQLPSIVVHGGIDICLVSWVLWPDEESKITPNIDKVLPIFGLNCYILNIILGL